MTRNRRNPMALLWILGAALLALASMSVAFAEEELPPIPYPLGRCLVADEPLSAQGALSHVYGGQELRFCCEGCLRKFEDDPQHYLEKMRAAVIADQLPRYPLESCLVSGAELGSMGPPADLLYRNRLVRLCCEGCRGAFEAEPESFIEKLNAAAIEQQHPDYPLGSCVITGIELGSMGPPVDYVHNGRLVRFCCQGCVSGFEADPNAALQKLDEATDAKPQKP